MKLVYFKSVGVALRDHFSYNLVMGTRINSLSELLPFANDKQIQYWLRELDEDELAQILAFDVSEDVRRLVFRNMSNLAVEKVNMGIERKAAIKERVTALLMQILERFGEPARVTLVLTDLVSSTERMRVFGDSDYYTRVLLTHNEVLTRHFEQHGGRIIKEIGDAFLVTFTDPNEAIKASVGASKEFLGINNEREEQTQIKVRIALHVGEIQHRENAAHQIDVYGGAINFVSRLIGVCAGGQIILSQEMKDAIGIQTNNNDPETIRTHQDMVKPVGYHSFKGYDSDFFVYELDYTSCIVGTSDQ